MRNTKYTDEEVQNEIKNYGFILDSYEGSKDVYAHDNIGYKYHFSLSNLRMGRKPDWLQHNPFALENIKLYLRINYPDYELLDDNYISCKSKMRFICHKHEDKGIQFNSFDNIVHNHHICKYCGYSVLSELKRLPDSQLIEMCKEKEVLYIGRKQYDKQTHIIYQCSIHSSSESQEMTLDHFRASRVPCRYCQITVGELLVKNFLEFYNIDYSFQHTFPDCKNKRVLEFDFYLPKHKIVIEYDGKQHYEPMSYSQSEDENINRFKLGQCRDEIKNQYCKQKGIKMIRIPYWDIDNINEILLQKLKSYINMESSETAG